ncbi:MAG: DUF373 family protein [Acidilobaceae archaeon]
MSVRPLVVVVDIDDDISEVLGVSVVRGEKMVLEAALSYASVRPEDADLNAIFSGLSLYRKLMSRGLNPDVAIVGGSRFDIIDAQVKVRERVKSIIEGSNDKYELYIVGDGLDEIMIAEVLGEVAPVAAVKRVVVEQHESLEASYALLVRYLRKALSDPRLAKYTLGIPGVIIVILALLSLFNLLLEALKISLLVLGLIMVIKGFGIEHNIIDISVKVIRGLRETPHMKLAGIVLLLALTVSGISVTYYTYSTIGLNEAVVRLLGLSIPITLLGLALYMLVGNALGELIRGNLNILNTLAVIIVLLFTAAAFHSLGSNLDDILLKENISLAEALLQSILNSRFIFNIIIGVSIAALLEILVRLLK